MCTLPQTLVLAPALRQLLNIHEEVEEILTSFQESINRGFDTRVDFNPCCPNGAVDSHSIPCDTQPFTVVGPGFGREPEQWHILGQKRLWKVIHCSKDQSSRAQAYIDLKKISLELEELQPGGIWDKVPDNSVNGIVTHKKRGVAGK